MKDRRFAGKNIWSMAGVVAVFAIGLAGGTLLTRHLLAKKQSPSVPKLSEVGVPPEKLGKLDPSSVPPIGLSPVPPEDPRAATPTSEGAGPGKSPRIPWAEPYPAHPFTLTDQEGRELSLKGLLGKVVLLNFIYTNCKTTCPLETQELKKLQEALRPLMGRDVVFLSITIDPKRDTPEVLKRYGQERKVDFRSWAFLTSTEEKIRQTLEAYHVLARVETPPGTPKGGYEFGHETPIYLIDQWGRVRKRTAPTMLDQTVRPAIEILVKGGTSEGEVEEDLESMKATKGAHPERNGGH